MQESPGKARKKTELKETLELINSDLEAIKAPEDGYVLGFRVAGVPFLFHKYFWAGGFFVAWVCAVFVGGLDTFERFFVSFLIGIAGSMLLIFVHELGHFVIARVLRIPLKAVVFCSRGGMVVLQKQMRRGFVRRMVVLAGGVLAQLILLIVAHYLLLGVNTMPLVTQSLYVVLVLCNLVTIILNLVPWPGSDGHQMLAVMSQESLRKMGLDGNSVDGRDGADTEYDDYVRIAAHSVELKAQQTIIEQSVMAQASLTFKISKPEYVAGSADLLAYGNYKTPKKPTDDIAVKCLDWTCIFILPMVAFGIALYFNVPVLAAIFFGVLVFLPSLLLSMRTTLITDKIQDYDADGELLGERTIALNEYGVFVINQYGYKHYQWENIKKIVNSPDYIIILLDMFYAQIIPVRVFSDETQKGKFLSLLDTYDNSAAITESNADRIDYAK